MFARYILSPAVCQRHSARRLSQGDRIMRSRMFMLALLTAASAACNAQSGQQQQQQRAAQQGGETDPTQRAAGGTIPAGWQIHLDDKDAARYTTNDVRFVPMGG